MHKIECIKSRNCERTISGGPTSILRIAVLFRLFDIKKADHKFEDESNSPYCGPKSTRVLTVRFHMTAEVNGVSDRSWWVIEWGEEVATCHKTTRNL